MSVNMSESLKGLIEAIKNTIFKENNGVLSPEYFLLKMIDFSEDFNMLMKEEKANIKLLRSHLKDYIDQTKSKEVNNKDFTDTESFRKLIQRTIMKKLEVSETEFDEIDLLITIIETAHLPAQEALARSGLRLDAIITYDNQRSRPEEVTEEERVGTKSTSLNALLKSFVVDLTEEAASGKLEPMIGRIDEVDRMEQILSRRKKNNPIIVGDAGVGKTAIVEGLAQKIASGKIHESLKGYRLLSLDVNGMVAGTKFRGDLEDRLKKIIEHVSSTKSILFIDEIHTIVSAGKSENGTDIGNTLKPYLSSGKIKCIGATTQDEYRQLFEKNSALSRRFNKVDVEELSPEATLHVLKQVKPQYEKGHGVTYTDKSLEAIVSLCSRFLHNKKFPDKAIDVLDETGAFSKLRREDKVVDVELVESVMSKMANQPVKTAEKNEKEQLLNLEANIKSVLFGQDDAVSKIVDSIVLAKSGLATASKPIGSYLFLGPTGVGKTELAKQLSEQMNMELLRFDMSEYMESHTVSKLIGAPAGYVGHGKGGLLTERVNKNPYAVLLLDEIEKAHPDVYNVFLQVLDYGFLTDSEGRKVDFRNTLIIMTSNAGVKLSNQEKNGIGFVKEEKAAQSMINWNLVNKVFAPEFRNRLDGIVEFKPIDNSMIHSIIAKNLAPIYAEIEKKGYKLVVDKEVMDELSKKGYQPEMGARPAARVVKDMVALPLAKLITFTEVLEGATITAHLNDGKIEFEVSYATKQPVRRTRTRKAAQAN